MASYWQIPVYNNRQLKDAVLEEAVRRGWPSNPVRLAHWVTLDKRLCPGADAMCFNEKNQTSGDCISLHQFFSEPTTYKPENSITKLVVTSGDGSGYEITIHKEGVEIGCQTFSHAEMGRLVSEYQVWRGRNG